MQDTERLTHFITRMTEQRIAVIGDIMLDRFVRGDVTRISPESPVPVLQARQETTMPGGAGNVILNLAGLGVHVDVCAIIGDDHEGKILSGLIASYNIDTENLVIRPEAPTTLKTRYLSGHQQMLRVDHEMTTPLSRALEEQIITKINALIPQQNAIILSDYGKGLLTEKILETAIKRAKDHGIPVFVDPKGSNYSKYKGASVITPNRKELSEAYGNKNVSEDDDIITACTHIITTCDVGAIIATRSQDGMSVVARDDKTGDFNRPVHLRTQAREVFDVSGAGDTVIATAAAAYCAGASLVEAASLANIAAGIVVGKVGTAAIRAKELTAAVLHPDSYTSLTPAGDRAGLDSTRAAHICDWHEALEEVERWRARGLKVGFTNGCFDILHAGHVTYLNAARNQCDRLVLGLNTDQSIKLLKGENRPINDAQSRAIVLGALGAVDLIVFFGAETATDDNTAMALIKHLKPAIYFKGDDYAADTLPEAAIINSYGGEVKFIPVTQGLSTSQTIAKITKTGENPKAA